MNRLVFALIWIAIIVVVLAAMWWGWRRRSLRDAGVHGAAALSGEVLSEISGVQYVSTTPVGAPLERVAAPGLKYRGYAEITVRSDGVSVQVRGENPVHISAEHIIGSGSAGRRVGKAVEREGLALLVWRSDDRDLESSFRFSQRAEQRTFERLVADIAAADIAAAEPQQPDGARGAASGSAEGDASHTQTKKFPDTTQEDA